MMFSTTCANQRNPYGIVTVILSAIASQCLGCLGPPDQTPSTPHLVRRLITPAASPQGSTGLAPNGAVAPNPCAPMELTAQTWVDLGIDDYIASYPNGDKLTIQQFAAELNMPNFFCGIGKQCLAGQLCHPAAGVNWLILYAIQEWNAYMNSFYTAIEDAISLMRDASANIASDFIPRVLPDSDLFGWSVATVVVGVLATFTGLIVPAVMPANAMQMVVDASAIGAGAGLLGGLELPEVGRTAADQKVIAQVKAENSRVNGEQAADVLSSHDSKVVQGYFDDRRKKPPPTDHHSSTPSPGSPAPSSPRSNGPAPSDAHLQRRGLTPEMRPKTRHVAPYAFTRWTRMSSHLTVLQNDLQGIVAATSEVAILQPLLARGGIAEILRDGSFLYKNPTQTFMADSVKDLAQITAMSEFFKSIKMFVTIASDECKFDGPNGARDGEEDLSSCTKEGLMMNIVRAEEKKTINNIPNARLLKSKYGYSVEYLAQLAWDCQKKYGVQKEGEPSYPPPTSMRSDCIFSIAVCDCTLPEVHKLRKKKKTTVVACRRGAGLPI